MAVVFLLVHSSGCPGSDSGGPCAGNPALLGPGSALNCPNPCWRLPCRPRRSSPRSCTRSATSAGAAPKGQGGARCRHTGGMPASARRHAGLHLAGCLACKHGTTLGPSVQVAHHCGRAPAGGGRLPGRQGELCPFEAACGMRSRAPAAHLLPPPLCTPHLRRLPACRSTTGTPTTAGC